MTAQFDHAWDDPRLNEEARAFLKTRPENLGDVWERIVRDAIGGDTAELSRVRNRRSAETPAPEGVEIADADANGVPVRLYIPASRNRPKKIVLYFHGGGWVIGSIQSGSRFCGELAKAADVIVAAAAYRLAPEFPYPAAVKDCREVYLWIRRRQCGRKPCDCPGTAGAAVRSDALLSGDDGCTRKIRGVMGGVCLRVCAGYKTDGGVHRGVCS